MTENVEESNKRESESITEQDSRQEDHTAQSRCVDAGRAGNGRGSHIEINGGAIA